MIDTQRKCFERSNNVNPDWSFKFDEELQQYVATDFEMTNQVDEFNEHWDTFRAGWQAAKTHEAEKLKAVHDSRIQFVEYTNKIESGDYVLVKKEDSENWYLDEDDYIWYEEDSIDGYLEDIDNGEVLEVQHTEYVVINSNPVFATNVFTDSGNITWELFDNRDDAEKAAAHCKAMIEAQESAND